MVTEFTYQHYCQKAELDVQKVPSSKAAAAWMGGAYRRVCEHGQGARTPLAHFFNILLKKERTSHERF
jgi:hypothetical protein